MSADICVYCKREPPSSGHRCVDIVKALYREFGPDLSCKELEKLVMAKLNNWSCFPAAFAMCMGVSPERMFELIGHDGSEIMWPDSAPPLNRRSFHIQEILYAAHKLNYSIMPVQLNPTITNGYGPSIEIKDEFFNAAKNKLGVHLGVTDAGINHAVAYIPLAGFWCPSQRKYIDSFNSREIWLVNKCTG